uniref:Elongation of very long chain fatty acids protein n=2 Tax=Tetranychus urticae TaxID=32264 RepID=T1KHB3_TETUR
MWAKVVPIVLCSSLIFDYKTWLQNALTWYKETIEKGDQRVSDWPLMSSPFPTLTMTAGYLYFVKIAGPRWMKDRQPFDLRNFMIIYNFALVLASGIMFIEMGRLIEWGKYSFHCQSVDYSNDPIPMRMCIVGWYFLVSKHIEFIDTIIFVLRKKHNQVSALHVFHHSVVPITIWIGMKYAPGGNNAFFPFLNSGVHTIMYFYYGLSAFGPSVQKYLWWKKYLTKLQLTQFTLAMAHGLRALVQDCQFPRSFVIMNIFHAVLFFYLFWSFYQQSYDKRSKSSATTTTTTTASISTSTSKGLTVSASSGPDGASTCARFGDVTITASVTYHNATDPSDFIKSQSKLDLINSPDKAKIKAH